MIYDGFIQEVNLQWLPHIPRFLKGIRERVKHAILDGASDLKRQEKVTPHWNRFLETDLAYTEEMERYRWMVEEYRISIFAQPIKTSTSVSAKRLDFLWQNIERTD